MSAARSALVSASMYTDRETATTTAHTEAAMTEPCSCPNCGKAIANPRRNQTYCSADCRAAATERKRLRNTEPKMDTCPQCGTRFEKVKKTKTFCSTGCQQAWNNHWKAAGPALALAMYDWRVRKMSKGMTRVCQSFSRAREALADKRAKAHASKGNTPNPQKPGPQKKAK